MLKNIYPLIITDKLNEVKEFYCEVLGFSAVFESDWYIQLEKDNNQIAFMIENSENQPNFLYDKFDGKGLVITFEYDDVDEVYKNFPKKESILQELKDEEWGQRHFLVKDPIGIIVDLVKYSSPEDYKS